MPKPLPCDNCGNTLTPNQVFLLGNDNAGVYRCRLCDQCCQVIRNVLAKRTRQASEPPPPTPRAGIPRMTTEEWLRQQQAE